MTRAAATQTNMLCKFRFSSGRFLGHFSSQRLMPQINPDFLGAGNAFFLRFALQVQMPMPLASCDSRPPSRSNNNWLMPQVNEEEEDIN